MDENNPVPIKPADERVTKSKFGFFGMVFLFILALALPAVLILVSQRQTVSQQAAFAVNNTTPLGFGSSVAYDLSGWRCKFIQDPNHEYSTANQQTFSLVYQKCKNQFFADINELASKNIKAVRLTPYIYQFIFDESTKTYGNLNNNINNLDEIINKLTEKGIKAHLVLNSVYTCGVTVPGAFDYKLFTDTTLQTQYLSGLSKFIDRYKSNPTIISYDLLNEVNALIENEYASAVINQPTVCMTATKDQIKNFLARMYTTAKTADKVGRGEGRHKFTFSLSGINNSLKPSYLDLIGTVDIYDIHMYVGQNKADNPENYYKDYPLLDKPVIHGEIGFDSTGGNVPVDSNGKRCDSSPFEAGYPAQASAECQQKILFNTKTWVEKAKERKVDTMFFHNWNHTNRFVFRTYFLNTSTNTFETQTYSYTLAGNYIINQNNTGGCIGRGCVTNTPIPILTNAPSPTPDYSVVPPAPTNIRAGQITSNSIEILWNDVSANETFFRVAYTQNTTPQSWSTFIVNSNNTLYTFGNLSPSTSYYFAVQACNGDSNNTSSQKCSSYITTPVISTQSIGITPTLTQPLITVTPTQTSLIACNQTCTSNNQCASGFCNIGRGGVGVCRNLTCPVSSSCVCQ